MESFNQKNVRWQTSNHPVKYRDNNLIAVGQWFVNFWEKNAVTQQQIKHI